MGERLVFDAGRIRKERRGEEEGGEAEEEERREERRGERREEDKIRAHVVGSTTAALTELPQFDSRSFQVTR